MPSISRRLSIQYSHRHLEHENDPTAGYLASEFLQTSTRHIPKIGAIKRIASITDSFPRPTSENRNFSARMTEQWKCAAIEGQ